MSNKVILCIAILIAIILGAKINRIFFPQTFGAIVLFNNSTEAIASAKITACGKNFYFKDIQSQSHVMSIFEILYDSHYDVEATFNSGSTINGEAGYLTDGLHSITLLSISPKKIHCITNKYLGAHFTDSFSYQ